MLIHATPDTTTLLNPDNLLWVFSGILLLVMQRKQLVVFTDLRKALSVDIYAVITRCLHATRLCRVCRTTTRGTEGMETQEARKEARTLVVNPTWLFTLKKERKGFRSKDEDRRSGRGGAPCAIFSLGVAVRQCVMAPCYLILSRFNSVPAFK